MAVTQIASLDDVEAVMGRTLTSAETPLADFALDKASEMFRREAKQRFTSGSSTVRLKINGGRVRLTQYPVVTVSTVVNDDAEAVTYTRVGQWLNVSLSSGQYVTVTYSHGGDAPDLVRLAIAEVAARHVLLDDQARKGVSQFAHTEGPFTESGTFAAWAVGGQVTLSPEDKALARSFRAVVPTILVASAPTTDSDNWRTSTDATWHE